MIRTLGQLFMTHAEPYPEDVMGGGRCLLVKAGEEVIRVSAGEAVMLVEEGAQARPDVADGDPVATLGKPRLIVLGNRTFLWNGENP